jgi:hypothetical protein
MKKVIKIVAVFFLLTATASAEVYKNETIGFTAEVPQGWEQKPGPVPQSVSFEVPKKDGDRLDGRMTLIVEKMPEKEKLTLEKYAARSRDNIKILMPGATVSELKPDKVGQFPAMSFSMSSESPELGKVEMFQIVTIINNQGLIIKFLDSSEDYAELMPKVRGMIESIKVEKKE